MSLGKDLSEIRKSQNLTLEDIQHEIKISVQVLESIENDSIFEQDESQITYTRSFVRSYAKALKIPEEYIVAALDAVEIGIYQKGILSGDPINGDPLRVSDKDNITTERSEQEDESDIVKVKGSKVSPPPEVDQINWADMGRKFTPGIQNPRIWVISSIVIILIFMISLVWIYRASISDLFGSEDPATEQMTEPEQEMILPADTTETESAEVPNDTLQSPVTPPPAAMNREERSDAVNSDTLAITVYAGLGQLDPVRVISDLNWRTNPFWMEQGEAYKFDFRDSILVRGQYSRILLLYNEHIIENPRINYFSEEFDAILITRDILQDPKYTQPAPAEFPLEIGAPDSVVYRIRF